MQQIGKLCDMIKIKIYSKYNKKRTNIIKASTFGAHMAHD